MALMQVLKTTLPLVEGDPVVGRALKVLLEGAGYEIHSLALPPDGHSGELPDETNLLLLPPSLSAEAREGLVSDLREAPALAELPVVALVAPGEETSEASEAPKDAGLAARVPWPSRMEALVERIEAALGNA